MRQIKLCQVRRSEVPEAQSKAVGLSGTDYDGLTRMNQALGSLRALESLSFGKTKLQDLSKFRAPDLVDAIILWL